MRRLISKFLRDTSGTTAIEYALILGVVSIAVVGGYAALANGVDNLYGFLNNEFSDAMDD